MGAGKVLREFKWTEVIVPGLRRDGLIGLMGRIGPIGLIKLKHD